MGEGLSRSLPGPQEHAGAVLVLDTNIVLDLLVFQDPATHNLKLVQVIVESMDYRYVDGWGLQRLISNGFPIDDARISYEDVSVFDSKPQAADTVYVVFDKDMNIANIIKP